MKPITYKITTGYKDNVVSQIEVEGFLAFELYGYQWGIHEERSHEADGSFTEWVVSEISTGHQLNCYLETEKEDAAVRAYKYLLNKGEIMVRYHVERARMKLQEYEMQQLQTGQA